MEQVRGNTNPKLYMANANSMELICIVAELQKETLGHTIMTVTKMIHWIILWLICVKQIFKSTHYTLQSIQFHILDLSGCCCIPQSNSSETCLSLWASELRRYKSEVVSSGCGFTYMVGPYPYRDRT